MNILKSIVIYYVVAFVSVLLSGCGAASNSPSNPSTPSTGTGNTVSQSGSTAAMLIHKDALYILDSFQFKLFDLSSDGEPKLLGQSYIAFAETMFIYDDYLYVGGEGGVDIWDINDPLKPIPVEFYQHVRGCDPIIVQDHIGYITLRNRGGCRGDQNRLEVVDFTNPSLPVKLAEYPMSSPYGLTTTDEHLAICQEENGLTLLDVVITEEADKKAVAIEEAAQFTDIKCFDLIYNESRLLFTATDGIYQIAVDGISLTQLSRIPVGD